MGQQQILLLVFGVVIVGIAIVVGITAFSENSSNANYDAMLNDMVRMAEDARVWKGKPELLGGSPDAFKTARTSFVGLNFAAMGYTASKVSGEDAECYTNLNAEYELFGFFGGMAVIARNEPHQTLVVAVVRGGGANDVEVIGILRQGVFVTNGERWDGGFPSLPNC